MNYDTPLTAEGQARLQKVAECELEEYDTYSEVLREELGATRLAKSHVYTFPCVHEDRRHAEPSYKETYVLKICSQCLCSKPLGHNGHGHCFLDSEVGVWKEAVRRGDDSLFCPIVAADRDQGWMLMEYCDPANTLSGANSSFEGGEMPDRVRETKIQLRDHGWRPMSTEKMDVEVMAFDDRLVVIDYEKLYHRDWMFDPLCWHWSKHLRRDTPFTAATELAIDEHMGAIDDYDRPIHPQRQRLVEKMHYSRVVSRQEIKREIMKTSRKNRRPR